MPYRDARAWLATVEERPRVDDVRVLKTPLEVTGGGRIIASARCAGRRRLLHICNVMLEQRLRVDDLGLRAQPVHASHAAPGVIRFARLGARARTGLHRWKLCPRASARAGLCAARVADRSGDSRGPGSTVSAMASNCGFRF